MSYICSICGHTSSSASGSSCSNSPVKTHIYIPVSKNGYICKFCGHTSSSASGGSCSSSPHKRHEYIAKKAGNCICKFCGHTSSSASGSSSSAAVSRDNLTLDFGSLGKFQAHASADTQRELERVFVRAAMARGRK